MTVFKDELDGELNTKQDVIENLPEIIEGAAAGATAVQPRDLSFTYSETFGIAATVVNGALVTELPLYIEDSTVLAITFDADSGYVVPMTQTPSASQISVSGASYEYEYDITGANGTLTITNATDDVVINIVCGEPGPEPGELTPFSLGQTITADSTKAKFDTSLGIGEVVSILSAIPRNNKEEYYLVYYYDSEDGHGIGGYADYYEEYQTNVFMLFVDDTLVFSSHAVDEAVAGWQNLDENGEIYFQENGTIENRDEDPAVNPTPGWNGILVGIVEAEPPTPTGLTPFEVGQAISGFQIDPDAIPTGYQDMTSYYNYLSENLTETTWIFTTSDDSSARIQVGYFPNMGITVYCDNDSYRALWATDEFAQQMGGQGGWYTIRNNTPVPVVGITDYVSEYISTPDEPMGYFAPLNGVVIGAIEAQPSALTPFEVGQTIDGFDFGDVENGDISTEMENFLADVEYNNGSHVFLRGESPQASGLKLTALNLEPLYGISGYILGVELEDFVLIYSTLAGEMGGASGIHGFQNLTNGKFTDLGDYANSTIQHIYDVDTSAWNGVLIGAVEAEPSGGLTGFADGQTITGYDFGADAVNGATSNAMDTFINDIPAGSYVNGVYSMVGDIDQGTWLIGVFDLDALGMSGGGKALCVLASDGEHEAETPVYATAQSSFANRGWDGLTDGKLMANIEGGCEVSAPIVDTTPPTWNGVLIGAVEASSVETPQQ